MDDVQRMNWRRVGGAVRERMEELKLSKAEVQRLSGVSAKTLDGYLAGEPIVRPDKARGLASALGWTLDSFDRLARGEAAQEAAGGGDPAVVDRLTRLEKRFDQFEELLRSALSRRDG